MSQLHERSKVCCSKKSCFQTFGGGCCNKGFSPCVESLECLRDLSVNLPYILCIHSQGPYGNLQDHLINSFIGVPLISLCKCHLNDISDNAIASVDLSKSRGVTHETRVYSKDVFDPKNRDLLVNHDNVHTDYESYRFSGDFDMQSHLQFNPVNKVQPFNYDLGFVTQPSTQIIASNSTSINMNDQEAYLSLVSDILSSGLPNYHAIRVPLPSIFNWSYLQQHIGSYHDGRLIGYLKFGFPLGLASRNQICSNVLDNHASANDYKDEIDELFCQELEEGALFGPFDHKPHAAFTWAP